MSKINFEPNFDPNTWCNDVSDQSASQKPIKKIICFFLDLLDILTPLTSFAATFMEVIFGLVTENKEILDIFMILLPSIPLLFLINYFIETL